MNQQILEEAHTLINEHVKMSRAIDKLADALCLAQAEIKAAPFNKINPHFKSKYADLAAQIETSKAALQKYGLSLTQVPSGKPPYVSVTTILMHKSGQWICGDLTLKAKSESPQDMGAAITYARRYGRGAVLDMSSEEDDDGNAASDGFHEAQSNHNQVYRSQRPAVVSPPQPQLFKGDASNYRATFGKYKDKAIAEINADELESYCNFILKKAADDGKPLKPEVQNFVDAAFTHLETGSAPRDLSDIDPIPF